MAQIHWSLAATRDLEQIEAYVAQDSVLYASKLTDGIIATVEKLEEFPMLGRLVPEFQRADLRELIYQTYRIVYLCEDDAVVIVRVIHGARDLPSTLAGLC
jgi:addiction module RelE/StbE family toxin